MEPTPTLPTRPPRGGPKPAREEARRQALKERSAAPGAQVEERPEAQREEVGPERALHCSHCGHPITHERHRTTVAGRHEHTRVNAYGIVFHFGCFSAAAGCIVSGPPTQEDTWFPGLAWEYAGCAQCHTHLGWRFRGESPFFALVLDRLRAGE